jgi:hypothetical protein
MDVETYRSWDEEKWLSWLRSTPEAERTAVKEAVGAAEREEGWGTWPAFASASYAFSDESWTGKAKHTLESIRSDYAEERAEIASRYPERNGRRVNDPDENGPEMDPSRPDYGREIEPRRAAPKVEGKVLTEFEVEEMAKVLGRKFEASDVTPDLRATAADWVRRYNPNAESWCASFIGDLKKKASRGLTDGQVKGVLNCMAAEVRGARRIVEQQRPVAPAPVAKAPAAPARPITDGMYLHEGKVVRVQKAVHGSGELYAKVLIPPTPEEKEAGGRARFEYVRGLVRQLKAEERMDLAQAVEYGQLYGCCIRCGAILTDEDSIEAAMGPICRGKIEEAF